MTRLSERQLCATNFEDLEQVAALAKRIKDCSVVQFSDRHHFTIVHTNRRSLLKGVEILYQT